MNHPLATEENSTNTDTSMERLVKESERFKPISFRLDIGDVSQDFSGIEKLLITKNSQAAITLSENLSQKTTDHDSLIVLKSYKAIALASSGYFHLILFFVVYYIWRIV
jgi:hypothetical protein